MQTKNTHILSLYNIKLNLVFKSGEHDTMHILDSGCPACFPFCSFLLFYICVITAILQKHLW